MYPHMSTPPRGQLTIIKNPTDRPIGTLSERRVLVKSAQRDGGKPWSLHFDVSEPGGRAFGLTAMLRPKQGMGVPLKTRYETLFSLTQSIQVASSRNE